MSLVELSFAGFALVGLLGIIGIVVIVTGRGPKNLNWKKNVEKKALKEDKSATNFLEPELPKGETETIIDEEEEQEVLGEKDQALGRGLNQHQGEVQPWFALNRPACCH